MRNAGVHREPAGDLPDAKARPYVWLVDVLQRMATHPQRDIPPLTPRLWKERFADEPMTSDIGTAELRRGLPRAA